jgi:hypothetical protein
MRFGYVGMVALLFVCATPVYAGSDNGVNSAVVKDEPASIRTLFDAASKAAFYANDAYHAQRMHQLFDRLKASGVVDIGRGADVYRSYIAAEEFAAARAFAARNPSLALTPLPDIHSQEVRGGLQEWRIASADGALSSAPFSLPPGPFMMVAASNHCHFSLDSMRALEGTPYLATLAPRTRWLLRIGRDTDFREIGQWNQSYPDFPLSVVRHATNWKQIDSWDTPTFYFFHNARLVYKFSGWPKEGNFAELQRGMDAAHFVDAAP